MNCNIAKVREIYGTAKQEVPILIFRRFKTAYHECRWVDYENILMVRTVLSVLSRMLLTLSFLVSGTESWDLTEQYFEKGGPPNVDLAKQVFPYAKFVNQFYLVSRGVFFILCLKWPRLIKMSIYFEGF